MCCMFNFVLYLTIQIQGTSKVSLMKFIAPESRQMLLKVENTNSAGLRNLAGSVCCLPWHKRYDDTIPLSHKLEIKNSILC